MTTRSLRDVRFALDDDPFSANAWSARSAADLPMWPEVPRPDGARSMRELSRRFANAGRELREFQGDGRPSAWRHIPRDRVITQVRRRLRVPGVVAQNPTDLCGPFSLLFEFARRRPAGYVKAIRGLLFEGRFEKPYASGAFVADPDLRRRPVPDGDIQSADWLFAATIRDDENVIDDIDDGEGIEGITWPFELEEWVEDVLGLRSDYHPCVLGGELDAMRAAKRALDAGGVAFFLVDSAIVHQKNGDTEEDVWSERSRFSNAGLGPPNARQHCEDDDMIYPNHYIVLTAGPRNLNSGHAFRVNVWSFASIFRIDGSGDGFGEYLYAVITGKPKS
jgi:hypothetical protein